MFIKRLLLASAYITLKNMPCYTLISVLETLLLDSFKTSYSRVKMFEEIAADAVWMLILLFWVTLAFIVIWGALWMRVYRKTR